MNDPENIYFNHVLIRPRDGSEASVELGSVFIKNKYNNS